MTTQDFSWSRPAQIAAAILFLAGISLPGIASFCHLSPSGLLTEKRDRAEYPKTGQWDAHRFELAFNDQFGFRDALVYGNNWVKTFVFHVSPTSGVIIGRHGWLYFRASINDYCGLLSFPDSEMEQWRRELAAKAAFFEKRGIRYVVAIAPNKESIYPEFLPEEIRQFRRRTLLDQLLEAFAAKMPCDLLDLRKPLRAQKAAAGERLFCRTDTHWNEAGALVAATEIIDHLRRGTPELPPILAGDYDRTTESKPGGDLVQMIGFPNAFPEDEIRLIPRHPAPPIVEKSAWDARTKLFIRTFESGLPGRTNRAILAGDSFGIALAPLLAPQFQRFAYIRRLPIDRNFDAAIPTLVEEERPDVFIELFVERNLVPAPKTIFAAPR